DITETIGFDIESILKKVKHVSYFGIASKLIENAGILVFKNGIVRNNTKRRLNIEEFRGFSIVDPIAPAVFINGADSFSAQIFTLFHEVAHIWIGKGGISDWDYDNKIEAFCNKVAAYILMPDDLYINKWMSEANSIEDHIYINRFVSKFFKVSEYASAIKAKELNLISNETFVMIRHICIHNYNSIVKKNDGGSPYYTIPYRNSNKITDAVLALTMSQGLPIREAGRILNIKADTVIELYKKRTSK
ncbi:ImmA/IrrE family metallo-endopeptidase, partial [Proteus terrae]|uniref:ImmA/IrrE family metallo-endopeptidase n=1 Tax=Proteus terrae TaxID=1574161 RepID=UPI001F1CDCA8